MGDRGRRRPGGGDTVPSATADALPDLPAASGHRFGPGLICSECGITWETHKREPVPCRGEPAGDPFARRPDPGRAPRPAGGGSASRSTPCAPADRSREDRDG